MDVFYEKGKKYNIIIKGIPYFRTSVTINGKRYQIYGDGEKDAQKKKEELKQSAAAGFDPSLRRATVGEVLEFWLYNVKRIDRKIKASTFARYDCAYRCHIKGCSLEGSTLSKLTSGAMQAYVNSMAEEKGLSGASIKETLKVWKMFCLWAVEEGYMVKNPCTKLVIPGKYVGGKRIIEVFTEAERQAIMKCMNETPYQYDALIKLAFATGMRKGELLALKWSDIEEDGIHVQRSTAVVDHIGKDGEKERYREIWDTKTVNAVRTIPILRSTRTMLKQYKHNQRLYFMSHGLGKPEFVFTTAEGKLIDPSSLTKSYKRLLERAGVPYRKFHAIRHTFATEAIRHGVDVKDLQMLMGHSDMETTYVYVQSNQETKQSAIEKIGEMM